MWGLRVRGWWMGACAGATVPALLLACTGPADGRRVAVDSATPHPGAAPVVSLRTPVTGDIVDGTLRLEATIEDGDHAASSVSVHVESDAQGTLADTLPGDDGLVAVDLPLVPGVHRVLVRAVDPDGQVGEAAASVRVRDLLAPSMPVVRIAPAFPWTGDALVAQIVVPSETAGGIAPTYAWRWTVDGRDAHVDGPEVSGFSVQAGQSWGVEVTAASDGATSLVASDGVVVGNAPPSVAAVAIVPLAPRRGDTLSCTHPEVVDPEDDSFTLRTSWRVDGVEVDPDAATLDTTDVARGSVVTCALVVYDSAETDWVSAPVVMGNGLPEVGAVYLRTRDGVQAPAHARVTDALTCGVDGVRDPDGDAVAVTYAWWIDGARVATGPRLAAGVARRGDVVECEASAEDDDEAGLPVLSAPLGIENSPPSGLTVQPAYTTVAPGEQASCVVMTPPTDADDDALDVVWSWSVDGVPRDETGDRIDTTGLVAGQSVTCTAFADDGFARGPTASATVFLVSYPPDVRPASSASVTLRGSTPSGLFGKVVRRLGDVDQDGSDELVVSAPDGGGAGAGMLYVFSGARLALGGTVADSEASWSFVGTSAGDALGGGRGLADGGDVDGDGLVDLVAASVTADAGALDAGEVMLVPGSAGWGTAVDVTSVASVRLRGALGDWLGTRLAVGDLNGDDLADVVASSPYNDLGGNRAGALVVMLGDANLRTGVRGLSSADAIITGAAAGEELGWALDLVGDVDGDGYADVGAGILLADGVATDAGAAAVLSGGRIGGIAPWTELSLLTVRGAVAGQQAGAEVAGAGDVDGDGLDDIIVGAKLDDTMGADAGAAWLFHGEYGVPRTVEVSEASVAFRGDGAGALLGSFATALGDVDADGLDDVLIGAPLGSTPTLLQHGVAGIYRGRDAAAWTARPDTPSIRLTGSAASDWFGVNGAGRLTVAGRPAVAVSAERADFGASDVGAVYVFRGF
jgi:hypothetical protein